MSDQKKPSGTLKNCVLRDVAEACVKINGGQNDKLLMEGITAERVGSLVEAPDLGELEAIRVNVKDGSEPTRERARSKLFPGWRPTKTD